MHLVEPYALWLGNAGDVADIRQVLDLGIRAMVDLALNEPIPQVSRDLMYCRFPLVDGAGNEPWMLVSAIDMVGMLLRLEVPTFVLCSAGLSRSPAIVAAALSFIEGQTPEQCLLRVTNSVSHDVSPGFWNDVIAVCRSKYQGSSSS